MSWHDDSSLKHPPVCAPFSLDASEPETVPRRRTLVKMGRRCVTGADYQWLSSIEGKDAKTTETQAVDEAEHLLATSYASHASAVAAHANAIAMHKRSRRAEQ